MALVKIQLKSNVLINGKTAGPDDENNGVYELEKPIAFNLIERKRAVLFGEEVITPKPPKTPTGNDNKPKYDLEALKTLADNLGVKYNPSIGGPKLNEKILTELQPKAEELKVDINGLDALKAYEAINAAKDKVKDDNNVIDDITEEELKEIAKEAEIDAPENATEEELKTLVKEALEDYASECKLETVENETIKATWERIKAKLKENDD